MNQGDTEQLSRYAPLEQRRQDCMRFNKAPNERAKSRSARLKLAGADLHRRARLAGDHRLAIGTVIWGTTMDQDDSGQC